ncbi:MAG TPA: ABC transporter permease [Gemmatimonadaceae bacterium]|nr:ABC transporter permease [Gemmatimonadaceae bacterium]
MADATPQSAARFDAIAGDVRYALRGLRLRPGFAAMVVLTLALGIGANATMFGIIDRLLLRAPAYVVDPDRVVVFSNTYTFNGIQGGQTSQPYVISTDLKAGVPDFAAVAVTSTAGGRINWYPAGRGTDATQVSGSQVSPDFFTVLGVHPWRGRFFTNAEAGEDNPQKLVVLGYGYWQRRFGGRDDAIGQSIDLGTDRYTVVGVAPKGFTGLDLNDVDVWIPIAAADGLRFIKTPEWRTTRGSQWLTVIARLKPGVRVEHAEDEATRVFRASERIRNVDANGKSQEDIDHEHAVLSSIVPGKSQRAYGFSGQSREVQVARLLGAVSFLVLLIACANVANLLLVRALGRRREIAVRLALGVSRMRLMGQLLIEGLLLSALGAAGALVCAQLASGALRRMLLGDVAWTGSAIDGRMIAFTAVIALATGMLTSVLPAWHASRADLTSGLKAGAREGGGRSPARTALLVGQSALAIVLLAGAGLFVQSLRQVAAVPLGVDVDKVLVVSMQHASVGMTNAEALEAYRRFMDRAHQVPGVTHAATSIAMSFGLGWGVALDRPGHARPAKTNNPSQYAVTPEYFDALGVKLLAGRLFTDADHAGTELVAVINETTAHTYWPGENPVGQCVKVGGDTMPCTTVVGVVANARRQSLVENPVSQIYRPLDQLPPAYYDRTVSFFGFTMAVRTAGDPMKVAEPLRRALQASDPRVPYLQVRPLSENLGRQTRAWDMGATMFSIFGLLALAIAGVGLYAVVSFMAAQRQREYGVRAALGATATSLLRLTMVRGIAPAAAGVVIGLAVTLALGRVVQDMLFQTSPRDPAVLGAVSGVLIVAAAVASLLPARRAARVNPVQALRSE